MQEAQANLKRAAVEFLEAAQQVAGRNANSAADPLDAVSTDLFELGDLEPAVTPQDLAELKRRLDNERLVPETIVTLVALARQVAVTLMGA
ncbi:MAG: hypothetical protein AMK72_00820 [Planctomycetes bacterium SM23_25]|nr:MAG: hypothetical protein AMK72_00820 [Planctomycetes bacterium SM23_25]